MDEYKCNKGIETDFNAFVVVGVKGFEPSTPCSQSRCANRTALRPDASSLRLLRCKVNEFFSFVQQYH